jgi:hypothetical protein
MRATVTGEWVRTSAPTAAHSSSSRRTMSLEERSQNSWPSFFSWYGTPCFSTRAMKSAGV